MPQPSSDLFKEKAEEWDARPRAQQLSQAIGDAILDAVPFDAGMRVMDFGAGTGLIAGRIAPRVASITAVDVSPAMLAQLAAKMELADKVETVCQDITAQPLDRCFELIASAMALHHVADTDLLLQRFAEHLEPGGMIALADLDEEDGSFHEPGTEGVYHHGFSRDALRRQLEAAGFEAIAFRTAYTLTSDDGRAYSLFLVTACKGTA